MHEALLYIKKENQTVQCQLCPHSCLIKEDHTGSCRVRLNKKGALYSLNYDKVAAIHLDPIEKKPLYHFLPGTSSLSIGTMGCNLKCKFCQNHSLSQVEDIESIYGDSISPEEIVDTALRAKSPSISYTYSEPTVFFELMLDTAKLAKNKGLKNVLVSNGFISRQAYDLIAPFLDAANIDLKAFSNHFYRQYCQASLTPVLETIREFKKKNIWIELTTLLIPPLNTDRTELDNLISFINEIGNDTPWHVSRFFPQYKLIDIPVTPISEIHYCLNKAHEMGIKYLYSGNVAPDRWANTLCPNCQYVLIERIGYQIKINHFTNGQCPKCKTVIGGYWS